MPLSIIAPVGHRYLVLDGGLLSPRERGNFWGQNVEAQCKVMGLTLYDELCKIG